jgi:phosphotriesterase-related protein
MGKTPSDSESLEGVDMVGKAMTVTGPIDAAHLGATVMHEHIFIDFTNGLTMGPPYNTPATEVAFWDEKLTLENVHLVRERGLRNKDSAIISDIRIAVKEVFDFKSWGGNTIVDVTNIGIGRDPLALRRVAVETGVNLVMGSGWYAKRFHPPDMDQRTVEDLTDEIVRDITVGVGETGVRSGIIGEIGIDGGPLTRNELKSLKASAWASLSTGAAISLHYGGTDRERLQVAAILGEEGVNMDRVIFGHSDGYADDIPFLIEQLEMGAYIQFDLLGRVGAPISRIPPVRGPGPTKPQGATTILVGEAVPKLIDAGFGDRILLSQDVYTKIDLKTYGGTGYSFILEKFVPFLRNRGVTEKQIMTLLVENPRNILTFAAPK